jgi:hypothetical protein
MQHQMVVKVVLAAEVVPMLVVLQIMVVTLEVLLDQVAAVAEAVQAL